MNTTNKPNLLKQKVQELYKQRGNDLLFHGWHHIFFVFKKALEFSEVLKADAFLVQSAALTHDLNYLVEKNSLPEIGANLRKSVLLECGYSIDEIERIESIVLESHTAYRNDNISLEGKALSDADTLFKSLPITPVLFSSKFISENNINVKILADKIVSEQCKLMDTGIYFYTNEAKEKYLKWAIDNLNLWKSIKESLDDPDVIEMLSLAKDVGVL